jgi:hypothetical protein
MHNDDNENDVNFSSNTKEQQRQSQPLSNVEKRDLLGAVEHLIIQGNYQRLAHWRKKEFQRRQPEKNDELQEVRSVHAQDVRLYNVPHEIGIDLTTKDEIHTRHKYTDRQIDKQWDVELADGIHAIQFTKQRLSSLQQKTETTTTTTGSLSLSSSSYELLLHCWERAVHAASCTVIIDNHTHSQHGKKSNPQSQTRKEPDPTTTATTEAAKEACRKYQIHELTNNEQTPYTCPNGCHEYMQFNTYEHLVRHFYGDSNSTRGCCWNLIHKKRQKIVTQILINEVRRQKTQLLQQMLQKENFFMRNDDTRSSIIKDWKDVLMYWEQALTSSTSTLPQVPTAQQPPTWMHTLQVGSTADDNNEPPLPINTALLEAVRNRLIERYAKVPR